ncbi:unnamed protein product, partial [Ascophyllum nodosum]
GRNASSWVGPGQGHFRRSQASPRSGPFGTGTQLFKLVETDLVSKELTRYGPSDAEDFGLFSIQEVLSDIATASALLQPDATVSGSRPTPSTKTKATTHVASPQNEGSISTEVPSARGEKVLAAWGIGQGTAQTAAEETESEKREENILAEEGEAVQEKMAIKRTYQPSTLKRKRKHGFLYRAKTRLGKKILQRRHAKGRSRLGI